MSSRRLVFAGGLLAATIGLTAQQPGAVHEKLYVSLEATDDIAVIDTATNKVIKRLTVGSHPHGQAAPRSQDRLYVATEVGGTVALVDTVKDAVIKVFDVGFGTEPQNGAITPDGRFLYQPSYAGYYQVFDTQKEEIIEYIHTLGIGHNTVMDPEGRFAYLLPIAGGPGHWKRPSLGLPRTQPKEVTVVDARTHKVVGTIPVGSDRLHRAIILGCMAPAKITGAVEASSTARSSLSDARRNAPCRARRPSRERDRRTPSRR
jgi:YVTN family beta-propeller protein